MLDGGLYIHKSHGEGDDVHIDSHSHINLSKSLSRIAGSLSHIGISFAACKNSKILFKVISPRNRPHKPKIGALDFTLGFTIFPPNDSLDWVMAKKFSNS